MGVISLLKESGIPFLWIFTYPSDLIRKTNKDNEKSECKEVVLESLYSTLGTLFIVVHCKKTSDEIKQLEKIMSMAYDFYM